MEGFVLAQVERFDIKQGSLHVPDWADSIVQSQASTLKGSMRLAGMADTQPQAACLWRIRAASSCACAGALAGSLVGLPASFFGFAIGACGGWASLAWALKARTATRRKAVEGHISEAVEVLCLGLRAGLSFERSLDLYCANFPSRLAGEFAAAQQVWSTGLQTREAALRNLAASYDSAVLARMVEGIVRSLRFGSPLADVLDDIAQEARRAHRASVEEAVMKAPVKMMAPIGLLILPSMLLFVMGPVMLELSNGM